MPLNGVPVAGIVVYGLNRGCFQIRIPIELAIDMETRGSPKPLKPGGLLPALRERTRSAIACGALHSIETEQRLIEESGVRFLVRSVSSLRRKSRE